MFFFPSELSATYTGCQTLWDENGQLLIKFTFRRGELVTYQYRDEQGQRGICIYRRKALSTGNAEVYPDYADAVSGFRGVDDPAGTFVPRDRDPRLIAPHD